MPLRDFTCPNCETTEERYYQVVNGVEDELRCEACGAIQLKAPLTSQAHRHVSTFPFTTPHIRGDGKPMTINSLKHLREVENAYGVKQTVYSDNPSQYDDAVGDHTRSDLPVYRPNGPER